MISVEAAGPTLPQSMVYSPNQIRAIASHVITKCVAEAGVGGYATKDISNMLDYLMSPGYNPFLPYRMYSTLSYITRYHLT